MNLFLESFGTNLSLNVAGHLTVFEMLVILKRQYFCEVPFEESDLFILFVCYFLSYKTAA